MSRYCGHQARLRSYVIALVCLAVVSTFDRHLRAEEKMTKKTLAAIVEQLSGVDDAFQQISIDNSQIIVKTTAIKQLVAEGILIVPLILQIMKENDISFDLFTRCYSVCDQVISPKLHGSSIWWTGGCKQRVTESGVIRLDRGSQIDETDFRKKVIEDIEKKYRKVKEND
jgi:hypothetical protein